MSASTRILRKLSIPFLAAAVLAAGISTSSQQAEAQGLSRDGRALLIAGAILGGAAIIGASAAAPRAAAV